MRNDRYGDRIQFWHLFLDTALKLCNNLMLTKKIKKEKLIYRKITERI